MCKDGEDGHRWGEILTLSWMVEKDVHLKLRKIKTKHLSQETETKRHGKKGGEGRRRREKGEAERERNPSRSHTGIIAFLRRGKFLRRPESKLKFERSKTKLPLEPSSYFAISLFLSFSSLESTFSPSSENTFGETPFWRSDIIFWQSAAHAAWHSSSSSLVLVTLAAHIQSSEDILPSKTKLIISRSNTILYGKTPTTFG